MGMLLWCMLRILKCSKWLCLLSPLALIAVLVCWALITGGRRKDPTIPNVQVTRLTLMCDQAPGPITMDLTGDLDALKKQNFVMKEGVDYRVKIHFKVNRDIVSGLKYVHLTYRKGLRVDKAVYMVGSYGPRVEEHEFLTPVEEAPKGMIVRGTYHIKSYFTDDDKTDHLSWEWNLQIKKDWTSAE
uniref:Rho GDP dissociation inhibitor (GDI) gamma n=1 Tax=Astyanax mexicanus TaxID=7994 RepID=A0A3B1KGF0_ASTMX